jgi:hypothetical protein
MMNNKNLWQIFLCVTMLFFFLPDSAAAEILKTPAEETGYTRYTQNEDIARFLSSLDFLSREVNVRVIGKTQGVEELPPQDLFLIVITEEGAAFPEQANRRKPTIFLFASQHGNEQSPKEAALWLARDLALGELKPLLTKANFLIIPQANPFGNWLDGRRNEQGLDLNRDHVKLESPEVRAIHRVFRAWMPEVTIDGHEKGDDYYRVSIGCVSNANIHPLLQQYSRNTILAEVKKNLEEERVTFHEYLVTEEIGFDTAAGELAGKEEMTRYSTTDINDGRNSLGIYETLSFIQEGASRHDLGTLEQRTRWQYLGFRSFIEAVADHGEDIVAMVTDLRTQLFQRGELNPEGDSVHLRMMYVRDKSTPTLTIRIFERTESPILGILKADKKAGEVVTRTDLDPYPYPPRSEVQTRVIKNWFPGVAPTASVSLPSGYIIPAGCQSVVDVLLAHGLRVGLFTADTVVDVEAYKARDVVPSKYDYLPPEKIDVEKEQLRIVAKKGDYFISCRQTGVNLIPCLLEAQSQYGLIRYWSFNLVPDKGNFSAITRLTKSVDLPLVPYRRWEMFP